ncbi:type IV pilus biogenesis/stability protein PilW [Halioxenophilus aromaticivorans]
MNNIINRSLQGLMGLAGVLVLVGCVTTSSGPVKNIDKDKALDTRIQLILSYIRQGNRDLARSSLSKAKAINAEDPRINNATALLYQLEGEPARAEEEFKKALRKDSDFAAAYNNYGVFLLSKERYEEALSQFQNAADNLDYDRRDMALTNLAYTAQRLGMQDKAKADFEQAIRLNPRSFSALVALAEIEFEQRNYANAKAYLNRAGRFNKPTAKALWLGIRLERVFGNQDKEASLALALKNLYPYSSEYLEYKRLLDE